MKKEDNSNEKSKEKKRIYAKEWRKKNKDKVANYEKENKELRKEYREKNSIKIKLYDKKYSMKNRDKKIANSKEWREKNKDKIIKYEEDNKELRNNYYVKNKKTINNRVYESRKKNLAKWNEYRRKNYGERVKNEPLFKLKVNIKSLISKSFKTNGKKKKTKTLNILGCSFENFKIHLEKQFEPWMNWNNHGVYTGREQETWQIDHIIPISSAKTTEDIIKINHFSNLRPLCSKLNLEKRNNII